MDLSWTDIWCDVNKHIVDINVTNEDWTITVVLAHELSNQQNQLLPTYRPLNLLSQGSNRALMRKQLHSYKQIQQFRFQ